MHIIFSRQIGFTFFIIVLAFFFPTRLNAETEPKSNLSKKGLGKFPKQTFIMFGHEAWQTEGNELAKARLVVKKIAEYSKDHQLVSNWAGGTRLIEGITDGSLTIYTCDWWNDMLRNSAFKSAGLNGRLSVYSCTKRDVASSTEEMVEGFKNANFQHISPALIFQNRIYTFDVWQYGFMNKGEAGLGWIDPKLAESKYNGMLLQNWVLIQLQAKRHFIGFNFNFQDSSIISNTKRGFVKRIQDYFNPMFKKRSVALGAECVLSEDLKRNKLALKKIISKNGGQALYLDKSTGEFMNASPLEQVVLGQSSLDPKTMYEYLLRKKLIFRTRSVKIIVNSDEEAPKAINNAKVLLTTKKGIKHKITKKSDGLYEITGVAPGIYKISIQAEGYVSPKGEEELKDKFHFLALKEENPEPLEKAYSLVPVEKDIKIQVLNSLGKNIENAEVRLFPVPESFKGKQRTNDDGLAIFKEVPPGKYSIEANARGFKKILVHNQLNIKADKPLEYSGKTIAVKLQPILSKVLVTVSDNTGKPVIGADVNIQGGAKVFTDAEGKALFKDIYPRKEEYVFSIAKKGLPSPAPQKLLIYPAKETGIPLQLNFLITTGGTISVKVIDGVRKTPVPNASLRLSGNQDANAFSDNSGNAVFQGLGFGKYYLSTSTEGFLPTKDIAIDITPKLLNQSRTLTLYQGKRVKVFIQDGAKKGQKVKDLIPGSYLSLNNGPAIFAPVGSVDLNIRQDATVKKYVFTVWAKGYNKKTVTEFYGGLPRYKRIVLNPQAGEAPEPSNNKVVKQDNALKERTAFMKAMIGRIRNRQERMLVDFKYGMHKRKYGRKAQIKPYPPEVAANYAARNRNHKEKPAWESACQKTRQALDAHPQRTAPAIVNGMNKAGEAYRTFYNFTRRRNITAAMVKEKGDEAVRLVKEAMFDFSKQPMQKKYNSLLEGKRVTFIDNPVFKLKYELEYKNGHVCLVGFYHTLEGKKVNYRSGALDPNYYIGQNPKHRFGGQMLLTEYAGYHLYDAEQKPNQPNDLKVIVFVEMKGDKIRELYRLQIGTGSKYLRKTSKRASHGASINQWGFTTFWYLDYLEYSPDGKIIPKTVLLKNGRFVIQPR